MMSKQLWVAAVVLVIAVTPTALDAWRSWIERPESRTAIVILYIIAAVVAFNAYEMFA